MVICIAFCPCAIAADGLLKLNGKITLLYLSYNMLAINFSIITQKAAGTAEIQHEAAECRLFFDCFFG